MNNPMLIPRYLGGKSDEKKYRIWDGATYDLAYIPYGGSLRWTIKALQRGWIKTARVADSDPAVRAVYAVWQAQEPTWSDIRLYQRHDSRIQCYLQDFIDEILLATQTPSELFADLKNIIDSKGEGVNTTEYAAAKILLHQFVHGGNVRCNEKGMLNVSPRTDKPDWSKWLKNYSYDLPWYSPRWGVEAFDDWSKVFVPTPKLKTIAFIDPPYSAPGPGQRSGGIGMSKAYANNGGNPNDPALLEMHKGAVLAAIEVGCDRIVATNYHGHWLQSIEYDHDGVPHVVAQQWVQYEEITQFMERQGFYFHDLGPLQGCTNRKPEPKNAGKKTKRAVRHEGWWELGGVRQHGRAEQMSLLEAAA